MKIPLRRILYAAVVLGALAWLGWVFRPVPIAVETARVDRGPMEVTIDERGEMRSHDRFTIAAPVAGRLMRIEVHDGDRFDENRVLALIAPLPLGPRERDEWTARVAAAEALQREAEERARHAEASLAQARRERTRVEKLVADGFVSPQAAEQARIAETIAINDAEAARHRARSAAAEVRVARAALIGPPAPNGEAGGPAALVPVRAPVAGRVLRIVDPSERVVAAGTPLMTIADLSRLEAVIEMLSTDAVRVRPGMPVLVDGGAGAAPLGASVRLVEPFAFTKVSALGIEEKRTRVIADLHEAPGPLGDGYRIEASVVLWRAEDVLRVPASAVFRCGEGWCAFVVEDGRARRREVELGQRNALQAQVLKGLGEGEHVVRYPSNDLDDGARVQAGVSSPR